MRRVEALLERYGASHRHPRNEAIHWVCVPLITWSLLALLWWLSPAAAYLLIGGATLFYLMLSFTLAIGMLALAVFVAAWVGQFVGHRIEGKKPSFLEDVRYLLVGPAWLLAKVYRRVGIPY